MSCDTLDSILDTHGSARLAPAELKTVAVHLAGCPRCAGAWAAHDALASEPLGEPAPELFGRVLRSVAAARADRRTPLRRDWRMVAGIAAAAAGIAVAAIAVAARYAPPDLAVNRVTRDLIVFAEGAIRGDTPPTLAAEAAVPRFVAGRDYAVLAGAPPAAADGVVPVIEFFMFGCYHCYTFEPELERWSAAAADHVALTRVPAVFNAEAELHARAFYTAEVLGKLDSMRAAFYDEIHVVGNRLASRAALAELFARFGVDAAAFDAAFDSSEVDARLRRAVELSRAYGVRATPSIVVAGRYSTSPSMAGSAMLAVVEQLVADESRCETRCNARGGRPSE